MTQNELTPQDLESEFRRVGTTWKTIVELARTNAPVRAASDALGVQLDIAQTLRILKSLPDGAGPDAFLRAFKATFVEPAIERMKAAEAKRRARGPGRGGAGA